MKRIIVMLCAALALFSCTKEISVTETAGNPVPVKFNLSVNVEADTKAAFKAGWENGDVVLVFFKGIPSQYLKLTYDGNSWTESFPNGEIAANVFQNLGLEDTRLTAVHFPYYDVKVNYNSNFFYLTGADNNPLYTYYLYDQDTSYTFTVIDGSGIEVSASISLKKPSGIVQFYVPGISAEEAHLYRLSEPNLIPYALGGIGFPMATYEHENEKGVPLKGYPYKGGVIFAGYLGSAGTTAGNYSFKLERYDARGNVLHTYQLEGTKIINEGVVVNFPALSSWSSDSFVDMGEVTIGGVKKNLKWATCNIGAENPWDYGDYFAWGETETYYRSQNPLSWKPDTRGYEWTSYKWCNDDYHKLNKYCTQSSFWDSSDPMDNKTVLDPEDDVAHVKWGGPWRIPTDEEWSALRNYTLYDWVWTNNYLINGTVESGVAGRIVTRKNVGGNDPCAGNSIFLPAAGSRIDIRLRNDGSWGYYWSSSLDSGYPYYAWHVYFNSHDFRKDYYLRLYGYSVRPVTE